MSTNWEWDAALVGDLFFDHVLSGFDEWPDHGSEAFASEYHLEIGGGAANTACALSRLGRPVALLGTIGHDNPGWFDARLASFGVATSTIERCSKPTGLTVSVSDKRERTFFTYAGANAFLSTYLQTSSALNVLERARHIHFATAIKHDLALSLFPHLRRRGCTVSIDVGWQPEWLSDDHTPEVLRHTDFFMPNEKEMRMFSRHDSPMDSLRYCAGLEIPCAVLKLGGRGAAMLVGETLEAVLPPRVTPVDTTGAGDAFNAGFLDAFLEELPPLEMLKRGCICGALSTRSLGALAALPTRDELSSFV